MRLIVACGHCRRQYDAAGLSAGSKFRCTCGEAVEVVASRTGHSAAVVRCSACGASRAESAASCRHCGSDFTLHELDLHTVCPRCVTRVSDRAKFCHHCGQSLASTPVESVATALHCPFCEEAPLLSQRSVGDPAIPVLECQRCAGLWIDHPEVEELVRRARATPDLRQLLPRATAPTTTASSTGEWRYRKCPHCAEIMNRRNLGPASGVVVDTCGEHGVWFDDAELHALLDWAHRGGEPGPTQRERERVQYTTGLRRDDAPWTPGPTKGAFDFGDLLSFVLRLL